MTTERQGPQKPRRDRFDSVSRIAGVGTPLLVMHGKEDRTVPIRFGQRLFAAEAEPKRA